MGHEIELETLHQLASPDSDNLWNSLPPRKLAATLIILYEAPDGINVVLNVRSFTMRSHPGETSLPGGRAEKGESWWDTALREAKEEIGFDATQFKVRRITALPAHLSRNYLVVRPCICFVESLDPATPVTVADLAPRLSADEVACVYTVTLRSFLELSAVDPDCLVKTTWSGHSWYFYRFPIFADKWRFADAKDAQRITETAVTGLTAHILVDAARYVLGRAPEFPALPELGYLQGIMTALMAGQLGPRI